MGIGPPPIQPLKGGYTPLIEPMGVSSKKSHTFLKIKGGLYRTLPTLFKSQLSNSCTLGVKQEKQLWGL